MPLMTRRKRSRSSSPRALGLQNPLCPVCALTTPRGSRNRRDVLGAMGQEAMGGFGRANVTQMAGFTGLSGTSASVPELFQYPSMPAGCEIYSLAAVLRAMGHDADPDSIVANQLPFDAEGDDYASAFWGDPYWSGEGMPPAIMAAGNAFLEEAGASERFANLTGTDFDELASKASSGTPVLVWTTLDFEDRISTSHLRRTPSMTWSIA